MPDKPVQSDECHQIPTFNRISMAFDHINDTLNRLDTHGERTAIALESLAAQSVVTANHERRLDSHDKDLGNIFERTRLLELAKERYSGAEEIKQRDRALWERIKIALTPHALVLFFFMIFVIDKFNIAEKAIRLWKEMKG